MNVVRIAATVAACWFACSGFAAGSPAFSPDAPPAVAPITVSDPRILVRGNEGTANVIPATNERPATR